MLEVVRGRRMLYDPVHANERSSGYSLSLPAATSPPGAILSSHAVRSWGFRATVLVGSYISRVYLGCRRAPWLSQLRFERGTYGC